MYASPFGGRKDHHLGDAHGPKPAYDGPHRENRGREAPFGRRRACALEAVAGTDAGRQLEELANGEHGHERAMDWQANMARERDEERHYSWVEGYMEWLEGKEARVEYHAFLEKELVRLKG